MTQCEALLAIFRSGRSITPLEALDAIGTLRLGARAWDLKQQGHDIRSELVELPSGKRVARYWLELPKGQLEFPVFQMKTLGGADQPSV